MATLKAASILVTGCNRGIGLELVTQLLNLPNPPQKVFATCRDPDAPQSQRLKDLASRHSNLEVVTLEVTDPASIAAAVGVVERQLDGSGLNVLVNNAGIMSRNGTLESEDSKDMLHVYSTNVVGPLLIAKAFYPLLKKAAQDNNKEPLGCGKAALVNVSTLLGSIERTPETFFIQVISYRCSKAALNMLTKCQSEGYKEDGIVCTALHPGWVQTDLGGAEASLTVGDSVRGIVQVLSTLSEKHNGILVDWEGNTIPW
ncbi:hypothetical protein FKM82_003496 [Ascaphus truei]